MGFGIVSVIMAVVSSMAQVYAQMEAAEAQNEALEAQYKQKEAEIAVEQDQITEQSSIEQFEEARRALRERAAAKVSSAEAGVLGNNLSRIMGEVDFDEMINMANIDTKRENQIEKTQTELDAYASKAETEAAEGPNMAMAGLQIIGSGVGAAANAGMFKSMPSGSSGIKTGGTTNFKYGHINKSGAVSGF
jgi:multidrug efflux pump subunit AcrA (membrane-fusion protein)